MPVGWTDAPGSVALSRRTSSRRKPFAAVLAKVSKAVDGRRCSRKWGSGQGFAVDRRSHALIRAAGCSLQCARAPAQRQSAQRLERGPDLGREQLRLFPGCEVTALVGLVEVHEVG